MRAGIKESRLILSCHLITKAQRPLNRHACIAKVGVVEDFRLRPNFEGAVYANYILDLRFRHVSTLITETSLAVLTAARRPNVASVEKLHLALAPFRLSVSDYPNVSADTCVVEHRLRQSDNGLEPVVLQQPLSNFTLSRARTAGEHWRAREDDG